MLEFDCVISGVSQGNSPTLQVRIAQFAFKSNKSVYMQTKMNLSGLLKGFSKERRQIANRK